MEVKALESGPLERLFNGSALAQILDFLTTFREWDYSKSDIAKNSGVSFRTALSLLEKLEALGLIKQTRRVGRAQMYRLDLENEAAKALVALTHELAMIEAKQMVKEELAKAEVPPISTGS